LGRRLADSSCFASFPLPCRHARRRHPDRATRDDLAQARAYGLRFDERGKAHRRAVDDMARIAAETLARRLDQAGFVVMKRPAAKLHSTPKSD